MDVLINTLNRLKDLYEQTKLEPGRLSKIAIKPQWNVVIGTKGMCGIAINFTGIHDIYEDTKIRGLTYQKFINRNLMDVAQENIPSEDMVRKSIGVAALSALSQAFLSPEALRQRGFTIGKGPIQFTDWVRDEDVVTVVGYGGLVRQLFGKCKTLRVTDMRPKESFQTLIVGEKIEYGPKVLSIHSDQENESLLGASDVVIITGSSLVNETFDALMSYSKKARIVAVYGPSVSFIPDVLFERGVDMVLSVSIKDPARFEFDMVNDMDMEWALKGFQRQQIIWRNRG